MTICIRGKTAGTGYASAELARFLREYTSVEILTEGEDAERCVTLEIDSSLPAHHYSLNGNGKQLGIRGGNASSVLCRSPGSAVWFPTPSATPLRENRPNRSASSKVRSSVWPTNSRGSVSSFRNGFRPSRTR